MTEASAKTGERFSSKAFFQGLAVVALVYAVLWGWVYSSEKSTLDSIQNGLAFVSATVERAPPPAEAYVYPPAPVAADITEGTQQQTHTQLPETAERVDVPKGPLQPAPFEGLYETGAAGKLPIKSSSGLTPFNAYKRPFGTAQSNPVVILAVRDYGLSKTESDQALSLPPEVTLILSPYSEDPDMWQEKARESGHEIWMELPMENSNFLQDDPGPQALLTRASLPENQRKLEWILSRATGYAGVVAETDKAFLDMHSMLNTLITSVFKRGLGYFELNTEGSEFIETLAVSQGAPFAGLKYEIDLVTEDKLTQLETAARQDGYTIATIALTPKNIDAVRNWALMLTAKGFALGPVSAVAATTVEEDKQEEAPAADADHGAHDSPAHHE